MDWFIVLKIDKRSDSGGRETQSGLIIEEECLDGTGFWETAIHPHVSSLETSLFGLLKVK